MKKNRTMIGTVIAVILIILLLNPQWLPVSMETREKIRDLEKSYFLIERSGRITVAHILTLILAISVLWVINVVVILFTLVMVWRTLDLTPLSYLIPSVAAEVATGTGFYYSKAKVENRIKLMKANGLKPDETHFNEF